MRRENGYIELQALMFPNASLSYFHSFCARSPTYRRRMFVKLFIGLCTTLKNDSSMSVVEELKLLKTQRQYVSICRAVAAENFSQEIYGSCTT